MKKFLVIVSSFFILAALVLFVTTKVSTAHTIAQSAVHQSSVIEHSVGSVQHVILTMFSQKTGPTGKGCTTATYFVLGSNGSEWVHVQLSVTGYKSEWKVDEIIEGNETRRSADCTY
jgi:hypothetical protein